MTNIEKLNYIHHILQECQNQLEDDYFDIQSAIELVEDIREEYE